MGSIHIGLTFSDHSNVRQFGHPKPTPSNGCYPATLLGFLLSRMRTVTWWLRWIERCAIVSINTRSKMVRSSLRSMADRVHLVGMLRLFSCARNFWYLTCLIFSLFVFAERTVRLRERTVNSVVDLKGCESRGSTLRKRKGPFLRGLIPTGQNVGSSSTEGKMVDQGHSRKIGSMDIAEVLQVAGLKALLPPRKYTLLLFVFVSRFVPLYLYHVLILYLNL